MNLKHPCPPLQSHLLLNRFGGECAHMCTSRCELRASSFSEKREKNVLWILRWREKSKRYNSVPAMLLLRRPSLWLFMGLFAF